MVASAVAEQFYWDSGSTLNEDYERERQIEEVSAVAT